MSSTAYTRSRGPMAAMWRLAEPGEDDSLVEMCLQLYDEDPGVLPVRPENIRATLRALRREPCRGRAVVLEVEDQLSSYPLLIAFRSNEQRVTRELAFDFQNDCSPATRFATE